MKTRHTAVVLSLALAGAMPLLVAPVAAQQAKGAAAKPAPRVASDETLTRFIRLRNRLRDARVDSGRENGNMVLRGLQGTLGGGRLTAECDVDWGRTSGAQRAHLGVDGCDVQAFLDAFSIQIDGRYSSRARGELDLRWEGMRISSICATLEGRGEADLGPGHVTNSRLLERIADVTGIAELRRLDFDAGQIRFTARRGVLHIDPLRLKGPLLRATLSGTSDLTTEQIEFRIQLSVSPSLAEKSSREEVRALLALMGRVDALKEADGFVRIPLPFVFRGTLSKPRAELDADRRRDGGAQPKSTTGRTSRPGP